MLNNPINYSTLSDMKIKNYKVYQVSVTNLKLQEKLDKIKENKTINFSATIETILEKHYHV